MTTRDLSNKRNTLWLGLANSIANLEQPKVSEISNLLPISEAVRWDGFDFGAQEAEEIDDRSLADEAGATLAGFLQFGGAVPFYWPKVIDTSSILRRTYNVLKTLRQELVIVERVGFKSVGDPIAPGDNVNTYRVMNDSFNPDTEGDGGYAYLIGFLSRGDTFPWTIVPDTTPAPVAIVGGAAVSLTPGGVALRGATYLGNNIARRATWVSSNPAVATVEAGIIVARSVGTASITASFPGSAVSTAVAVTVTAA